MKKKKVRYNVADTNELKRYLLSTSIINLEAQILRCKNEIKILQMMRAKINQRPYGAYETSYHP